MQFFNKKCLLVIVIFFGFLHGAVSQVKTKTFKEKIPENAIPAKGLLASLFTVSEPAGFDSLLVKSEESSDNPDFKSKFAEAVNVRINVLENAQMYETNDSIVYVLKIVAKKARSLSMHFGEFYLSANAVMALYTDKELTDSITYQINSPSRFWGTRIYEGNAVNLALKIPLNEKGQSALTITQVNFGYQTGIGAPGASASCNKNVSC